MLKKKVNAPVKKSTSSEIHGKKEKVHTKFDESLFTLHPYFEEIIERDCNSDYRFIGNLCKENGAKLRFHSGWREGLRDHLQTNNHRGFTPKNDLIKLEECIHMLGGTIRIDNDDLALSTKEEQKQEEKLALSKSKEIELYFRLAQFLIDTHLPFSATEQVLDLIKSINQTFDPHLLQRAHLSNVSMAHIIRNCIGSTLKELLFKEIKNSCFSILVDETSDLFGGNYIGLLIRYLKKGADVPIIKLLSVIELGDSQEGETLYEKITKELFSNDFDLRQRIVGICTDNAQNISAHRERDIILRRL